MAMAKKKRRRLSPDERRQQIKEAGLAMFTAHGFEATTIDQIAEAAAIAKGTFYLYFDSKLSLLVALLDDFASGVLQSFATLDVGKWTGSPNPAPEDIRALLEAAYRCFFEFCTKELDTARLFFQEAVFDPVARDKRQEIYTAFAELAQRALDAGIAAGVLPPMQSAIVSHAIVGMVEHVAAQCLLIEPVDDLSDVIAELARFETYGISR